MGTWWNVNHFVSAFAEHSLSAVRKLGKECSPGSRNSALQVQTEFISNDQGLIRTFSSAYKSSISY